MKVAHFSLFAPHRSGLFSYVIDQIKYERRLGIESIFIHSDIENPDPNRFTYRDDSLDREVVARPWSEALDAEVIILHRSIPWKLNDLIAKKKSIAILHGTSEILMLHEVESSGSNDKFNMHVQFMDTFKKVVTITKSDTDIMKLYEDNDQRKNKIVYIPDAIDMEYYSLEGFEFPYRYRPSIISTTNVRINKVPSFTVWAMPEIIKRIPKARLNMFGLNLAEIDTWKRLILKSPSISVAVENIHGQFMDLRPFLRGADISVNANNNGVFSRDSMEAMALGCSIVAPTNEHTKYAYHRQIQSLADAIQSAWEDRISNPERVIEENRAYAEEHFCMKKAVDKFVDLYNNM